VWRLAALGVPTSAGMMVMSIGAIAMNRVIREFGDVAVAAYGAANKVDMIVGMPIFGLAAATVAVIGMFAGAGRIDLVRSTALYAYRWALILAVSIGATAYLASDLVLMIFIRDVEALDIGRTYLGFMIFAYPMMAIGMTTGRLLQGLGHGIPSLIITAVRVLVIAVPAAYLSVYWLSLPIESIWSSMLLSGLSASVIALIWVRQLVWKRDPTSRAIDVGHTTEPMTETPSKPAPAPEPLR
jgi:Na+-driven multidrug efflux pump